ncbi:gamma-glutamylcyclotransferase family protein [Pedobacter alpinus]|uniref:Gamma-glutamylcyclotransferase family protein n=2 Tax=Pedobacter alpinus TaxID=1590643 RepID=A0ABW5TM49_9SPHI
MENTFLYFGYGSGLNLTMVEFRVNEPVKLMDKGELKNYAFRFSRKNPDGSARGNLQPAENEYTLGLLYQIDEKKFEQLSQTEPEYNLKEFDIITENGVVKAFAFICSHCETGIYPDLKYVENIISDAIAHNFPEDYIEKIRSQAPAK